MVSGSGQQKLHMPRYALRATEKNVHFMERPGNSV